MRYVLSPILGADSYVSVFLSSLAVGSADPRENDAEGRCFVVSAS